MDVDDDDEDGASVLEIDVVLRVLKHIPEGFPPVEMSDAEMDNPRLFKQNIRRQVKNFEPTAKQLRDARHVVRDFVLEGYTDQHVAWFCAVGVGEEKKATVRRITALKARILQEYSLSSVRQRDR
jgi:hypothetical protein